MPNYKKIFKKKEKCVNLQPKMLYLGTFGLELEKAIVISEITTLEYSKINL